MRIRTALIGSLVALALLVVGSSTGCARGSGYVVSETRSVGEFDAVEVSGIGRLEIAQGPRTDLVVEADDNLLEYIETEVSGNTLSISVEYRGLPFVTIDPSSTIIYRLTVPELSSVSLSGSGVIFAESLDAEDLAVAISGSGSLEIEDLQAEYFSYNLSGTGTTALSGRADSLDVNISGSGRLDAGDLRTADAFIEISGSGRATVWVTDRLDVNIAGSGDVEYYGSPRVDQNVTGSGDVEGLGSK